ncbi:coiled-coil domain-containing protein 187 isoform X2 [Myxocyprinus asiaticus]|uniref:coiled-coil domain-containing protein 187 isoform X2 n=1 Tax=Myxocyprinus asiaticus TaxID=70543 RepID=UPI002222CDC8|nr:coiled-coil domain-containing protein 187 isoform X2 [Myxocyprinus asiaticus]
MAELEVDQSNLPRVQEVCQCFAVLEDGALAHNLQEQEIEQYYTSNVQRNQLVQKDIRVAKTLQDEEQQRAQMLQHQTTRQLEERDLEYARMMQEEIQRCAEEALRREVEDEEIAKRIQEEEELCVRHRSCYQNKDDRESTSVPSPPYSPWPAHTPHTEHQYYHQPPNRRWQHSPSPTYSDSEEDLIKNSRPKVVTNRIRMYRDCRQTVGQQRKLVSSSRPSRAHLEQDKRSTTSQSSTVSRATNLSGGWGDVIMLIKNDLSEQGYLSYSSEDELFEPVYKLERILRQKQQVSDQCRLSRHSSVRENHSRTWQREGCSRRVSFRDRDQVRHVHFLDERRRSNSYHGNGYGPNETAHNDTRERDAAMLRDNHTHPTLLDSQLQTQSKGFQRNNLMRRSYHGDIRLSMRTSVHQGTRTSNHNDSDLFIRVRPSIESRTGQLMEVEEEGLGKLRDELRGRNQRQRAHSLAEEEKSIERDRRQYCGEHRVRRSQSENWQIFEEEGSSTDVEGLERETRREERWMERPRNLSQSCSDHSSRAGPAFRSGTAALDLGELEQVLLDEELALRLQEQEERLATETPQGASPLSRVCPVGDFRVAQVAQDEEIARFIQKQEIKAKQRSRELDPVEPGREYRENVNDKRAVCDRQRERQDFEGLQSPFEDFTQDHQLSSPVSMAAPSQPIRNVAEELDPTFQRKETTETGLTINGPCQNQTSQQVGLLNPLEEPTFVAPTKRQSDKLGRVKTKEKKENVKQKENCKQQ